MNLRSFATLGRDRVRAYGSFEIPSFSESIQFDSRHMVAAMVPHQYIRGYLYYRLDLNPHLQKIQVHDLIWGLWGSDDAAHNQMTAINHYIENDLAFQLETFNRYSKERIEVKVTVLYSDNPQYPPDTVPRYVVCRLSRPADLV